MKSLPGSGPLPALLGAMETLPFRWCACWPKSAGASGINIVLSVVYSSPCCDGSCHGPGCPGIRNDSDRSVPGGLEMCGLAGVVGVDGGLDPAIRGAIRPMTRTLAHRGPDGEGFHADLQRRSATGGWRSSTAPAGVSRCRTKTARAGSSSTAKSTTIRRCGVS